MACRQQLADHQSAPHAKSRLPRHKPTTAANMNGNSAASCIATSIKLRLQYPWDQKAKAHRQRLRKQHNPLPSARFAPHAAICLRIRWRVTAAATLGDLAGLCIAGNIKKRFDAKEHCFNAAFWVYLLLPLFRSSGADLTIRASALYSVIKKPAISGRVEWWR